MIRKWVITNAKRKQSKKWRRRERASICLSFWEGISIDLCWRKCFWPKPFLPPWVRCVATKRLWNFEVIFFTKNDNRQNAIAVGCPTSKKGTSNELPRCWLPAKIANYLLTAFYHRQLPLALCRPAAIIQIYKNKISRVSLSLQ